MGVYNKPKTPSFISFTSYGKNYKAKDSLKNMLFGFDNNKTEVHIKLNSDRL